MKFLSSEVGQHVIEICHKDLYDFIIFSLTSHMYLTSQGLWIKLNDYFTVKDKVITVAVNPTEQTSVQIAHWMIHLHDCNNCIIKFKTPRFIRWCTNLTYSVVTKLTIG